MQFLGPSLLSRRTGVQTARVPSSWSQRSTKVAASSNPISTSRFIEQRAPGLPEAVSRKRLESTDCPTLAAFEGIRRDGNFNSRENQQPMVARQSFLPLASKHRDVSLLSLNLCFFLNYGGEGSDNCKSTTPICYRRQRQPRRTLGSWPRYPTTRPAETTGKTIAGLIDPVIVSACK